MKRTTLLLLGIAVLAAPSYAGAAGGQMVLATSQTPVERVVSEGPDTGLLQTPNQVNGVFADLTCGICTTGLQIIAENFTVSTAGMGYDLDEIFIWGGYYPGDVPTAAPFDIIISADAAGVPGATVCTASGITPTTDVLTGVSLFGVSEHLIQLNITPCNLADGTYWLYLYTDTGAGDDFFWEVGNLDATNGIAGSLWSTTNPPAPWNPDAATDLSLHITGTVVPVELQSFSIE
jgi:hypothetical protein